MGIPIPHPGLIQPLSLDGRILIPIPHVGWIGLTMDDGLWFLGVRKK